MRYLLSILILLFCVVVKAKELQVVKVVNLNDAQKDSLQYFHQLLADALEATQDMGPYQLQQVDFNVAQKRSMRLLKLPGVLDVMHTMQDQEWEQSLIRVPQPLLNGTLGTRAILVRAEDEAKYNNISLTELKQQIACQGTHWRDSDILEANGFSVYRVVDFQVMLKMLAIKRCDYFPRGISEIDADFAKYNGRYGKLAKITKVFFQYQAPIYFYLGKHNMPLATRLNEGFKRLGGDDYIKQKLADNVSFELSPYLTQKDTRIIQLKTDLMP